MSLNVPDAPPPSYEQATGSSSSSTPNPARLSTEIPAARRERNGIPMERRRSMEDESRPLPPGWVRQFDTESHHQFFVDTTKNPPRSIWVHPYDDDEYLSTLSPEERKKLTRIHRTVTLDDITAESSDEEGGHHATLPPRTQPAGGPQLSGIHKFGRKMKDKVTGSTHEERERARRRREEEERKAYLAHMRYRQAMIKALQTGEPQLLGKDAQGRNIYIEPMGGRGVPHGGYGISPFGGGVYAGPNQRYMRPAMPYARPVGYGYGGGLGMPLAAGLIGGSLLGGLMF
ncbi:hypothetical protein GQ43DRAFT_443764 [Delitschia confertaspora ATCC 74209]|uniref:WW domain-containing protein n=1 Tax=Delitschia confertaspora ATCC 74209 TaxID=1513339 RepID=A0A9P4MPI3_9PLEO|nr:hypothetical protein GQ43DRAFT_443764 [Delitschia confertaspora ATCC 74209]